jgi:hypothetical protein
MVGPPVFNNPLCISRYHCVKYRVCNFITLTGSKCIWRNGIEKETKKVKVFIME